MIVPREEVVHEQPQNSRSIGELVVEVLREAGKPLKVQVILKQIRAKGRSDLVLKTLGGVLSQYLNRGVVRRTARATYALPVELNGANADAR